MYCIIKKASHADNISCIINGIWHGICRVLESGNQRCHKLWTGSVGFVIKDALKNTGVPDVTGDIGFT
jgi:hypothetical protein